MAKPKISEEAKTFIVQSLACYDSPSTVAAALKRSYGIEAARQAIESYDPTKTAGARLAPKWRAIFEATRETFVKDVSKIGISHKAVRLRRLQRMADRAEEQGNTAVVMQILEQAAKEEGGFYTNRREFTGKDGKDLPAPVSPVVVFQLPDNGRGHPSLPSTLARSSTGPSSAAALIGLDAEFANVESVEVGR
ncbi:DUF2280 domain-containing protein [Rhizobium leguminosarum]|uniref:DUF2280 domain-containing protein n=1 Tax=Rhizobium leguminosarum TaxID=384 RepID=A0A7K3VFW0_RHILE|nr:DUF2280 domain-containing protein [Rhizobium leguminosarum]NEK15697.1 DUF2280 domain-containing protein [Rhizobium leguminosarum]